MVTLQKNEKRKNHSNRVKITLKTSQKSFQSEEIAPKRVKITPKE